MSYTLTHNQSFASSDGDAIANLPVAVTNGKLEKIAPVSLTSLQTNVQIDLSFLFAKLKMIVIVATRNVTLKTNATDATGGDTVTLYPNDPFVWRTGSYGSNPFTANVATAYLNNLDSAAGTVTIWYLTDPLA